MRQRSSATALSGLQPGTIPPGVSAAAVVVSPPCWKKMLWGLREWGVRLSSAFEGSTCCGSPNCSRVQARAGCVRPCLHRLRLGGAGRLKRGFSMNSIWQQR